MIVNEGNGVNSFLFVIINFINIDHQYNVIVSFVYFMLVLEEIYIVIIIHRHYQTIKKCQLMVKMVLEMKVIDGKLFVQLKMIIG